MVTVLGILFVGCVCFPFGVWWFLYLKNQKNEKVKWYKRHCKNIGHKEFIMLTFKSFKDFYSLNPSHYFCGTDGPVQQGNPSIYIRFKTEKDFFEYQKWLNGSDYYETADDVSEKLFLSRVQEDINVIKEEQQKNLEHNQILVTNLLQKASLNKDKN